MRILWFTNMPSLYKRSDKGYNGGGWISSLEEQMIEEADIELGISFLHPDSIFKIKKNKTTYYPISLYKSLLQKIKHQLYYSKCDNIEVETYLKIVEDFKPDIIHVFGTEQSFGLISKFTSIPVVIHIQGILGPYLNAYFAPGSSQDDYCKYLNIVEGVKKNRTLRLFTHNVLREELILKSANNFMGRTQWDKDVTRLYAPESNYFYCSEILRPAFYSAIPWRISEKGDVIRLVTTISKVDYKGFDLVLKTALLLKKSGKIFEWKIFGIDEFNFWEKKLNIQAKDVDVILMGVATAEELIQEMQNTDIYIHPSYIDNSPNSICEAQLLGIPIISNNVGGISSLIEHGVTGLLIPANDPYSLTSKILYLKENRIYSQGLGGNAREMALKRHDIKEIVNQNINTYKSILNNKNDNKAPQ